MSSRDFDHCTDKQTKTRIKESVLTRIKSIVSIGFVSFSLFLFLIKSSRKQETDLNDLHPGKRGTRVLLVDSFIPCQTRNPSFSYFCSDRIK